MESKYIDLTINRLTQAQYDELKNTNKVSEEELYIIIDHDDLFYYKTQLYTKDETDGLLETIRTNLNNTTIRLDDFIENIDDVATLVKANQELQGDEEILDSITIEGVNYQVYPEGTIEFNDAQSTDQSAVQLGSIKIGNDIWNIPSRTDLSNYYTKDEITDLISGIDTGGFAPIIVDTLPSTGEVGKVYLTPVGDGSYQEYLYINNNWELIGSTAIDLSDYALKSELPVNTSQLNNDSGFVYSSDVYTKTETSDFLNQKVSVGSVYTKEEIDNMDLGGKVTIRDWGV